MPDGEITYDVIIIGGGQAGLALGYYLKRAGLSFLILDAQDRAGGAWLHGWSSLHLFSPAEYSSLPGWQMPGTDIGFPGRDHVIEYLARYEERYSLPIERKVVVSEVLPTAWGLEVRSSTGAYRTRSVVCATGTWSKPFVPDYPGLSEFTGKQIHSASYRSPVPFEGKRVLIVGGGNSGAQIMAEVSAVADANWVTQNQPTFLPDDVDGRVLFSAATARVTGETPAVRSLGDIVVVPPVRSAREHGRLKAVRPFERFDRTGVFWKDRTHSEIDAVIWCTGFRPATDFLLPLGIVAADGTVELQGNRSTRYPSIWFLGYGNWTGEASATLVGAARTARQVSKELVDSLMGLEDAGHRNA